ncbi:MAG: glycosyltransferase [FCB group bacterium]|nr:glycosyltransferase [FCB group bacterium]
MKVAHFSRFAPNLSGQYGTVKDLIKAEREQGIDARLIAVTSSPGVEFTHAKIYTDEWLTTEKMEWAEEADVLVRHVLVPQKYMYSGKQPKVMCLHGRPENSFLLGVYTPNDVYRTIYSERDVWDSFVSFWDEHIFHWSRLLDKSKLHYVPAMCDLEKFRPEGPKRDFGENSGSPNIVIVDQWREDTTPYNVLHAALLFQEKYCPTAKVHVYGIRKNDAVMNMTKWLDEGGGFGDRKGTISKMVETYRAADMVVTPHVIATRVIREAMACGTPIVAGGDCPYTQYGADPRNIIAYADEIKRLWDDIQAKKPHTESECLVAKAANLFNLEQTGVAMKKVLESAVANHKPESKEYAERLESSRAARRRAKKAELKQLQKGMVKQHFAAANMPTGGGQG